MPAILLVALLTAASAAPDVRPWALANISSDRFESHPAFDPRNGDLYFVRSSPSFEGWRIVVSHCGKTGWSVAEPAPFGGDGVDADPWFDAGGNTLWFISARKTDGKGKKDLDLFRVTRDAAGQWGKPERLPEPVNSTGAEWFPRMAPDGWLYFGSNRPGGIGKTDIWRAKKDAEGAWRTENLGAAVNTDADEYEPLPSADGKRLVFMADGLYQSLADGKGGWLPRTKLPVGVNVNGTEIGALFSPSGKSLMFARDTKGEKSGELFVWYEHGPEDWPPACPKQP